MAVSKSLPLPVAGLILPDELRHGSPAEGVGAG